MLLELRVKDLGIIEDIDWKLDTGLNVITGETGAGKSLIIDAVELLLFGTAGEDIIRHGAYEARIEGIFAISQDRKFDALNYFLEEKGLASDEDTLIISCEVRRQKPGLVRINGRTVTKTILRQTGQLLIDIHGQSEHLSLLDKKTHLNFLDAYAHTDKMRKDFSARATRLRELNNELESLADIEKDTARQEEFLKYQIDEIEKAKLQEGEDEELEKELHIISYSEKLKEYSTAIYQALYEGDTSHYPVSALFKLNEAVQSMKKLVELDPALNQQLEYLDKTIYGLEDIARDIRSYSDNLEHHPEGLEEIESRLELIRNLKRKYGKTIGDILIFLEKSKEELAGIETSAEKQSQMEKERDSIRMEMGQRAGELSRARFQGAARLTADVIKELHDLEMEQMQFGVFVTQTPSPSGISGSDGKTYSFNNEGIDTVEFMVSTNPGEPLKPLTRIASTGEISRFTLALKGALSEADSIPVLIFDEIDIGVGGRSGDAIGRKLWTLARNHQVICVTHLPQIAAYADAHFCVHKGLSDSRTISTLDNLTGVSQIRELAAMLTGPAYTETALNNASELKQKADEWKNNKK